MKFEMKDVADILSYAVEERPTGDVWLDARYLEDIPIIGHTNPYYRTFYRLAEAFHPSYCVELGSWRATAAAHFAAGNPNGCVLTIDIHREDKVAQVKTEDAAAHFHNLMYLNGWTWDDWVVKEVARCAPIDILFVDAWHDYEKVMRELSLYTPMMSAHSLIIFDDLFDDPSATKEMLRLWAEMQGNKLEDVVGHCGITMGYLEHVSDK